MGKEMEKLLNLAKEVGKNFKNFYLAGGTAIALKYRHRVSEDLDFFSEKPFSFEKLSYKMRKIFNLEKIERGEDNIDFYVENIRISFIFFPFKNIEKIEIFQGIKRVSDYDIFLNKIYAAGRRVDPKDPIDCAFLYKIYRWDKNKIEKDFEKKFPNQSYKIFLGALLNFDYYPSLPTWIKEELITLL